MNTTTLTSWENTGPTTPTTPTTDNEGAHASEVKLDDDSILTMLANLDRYARNYDWNHYGLPMNEDPRYDAAMCEIVRKWLNGNTAPDALTNTDEG